jgi:Ser/Thr protein kinase RdoA (MazF antagonist)
VGEHDLSAGGDVLRRVGECATDALAAYGCHPATKAELLTVSENATFLLTDPDAGRSILRVHRLGYHSETAIASELAWMDALRAEAGVRTPRVLPARDGRRVISVPERGGLAERHCVRFEFLPGAEPAGADGAPASQAHFAELGEITARMHGHARTWAPPAWFTRFAWNIDAAFGATPRWGHWRDGVGVRGAERGVLGQLEAVLRKRLAAFGTGPERYGLVHADTRLANLLVHEGSTAVIDFDDAGFGWYLYDLGTAVSFFEHDPAVPSLVQAWLEGYRGVASLSAEDEAEIWTFIMFRRLLLVAWIGSHQAAPDAAALGAAYTRGTCDLADRYLSQRGF